MAALLRKLACSVHEAGSSWRLLWPGLGQIRVRTLNHAVVRMINDVSIPAALIAGLVSFLSPCVLPLVPPYLIYLTGATIEQVANNGAASSSRSPGRLPKPHDPTGLLGGVSTLPGGPGHTAVNSGATVVPATHLL